MTDKILLATSVTDLKRINTTHYFKALHEHDKYVEGKLILQNKDDREVSIIFTHVEAEKDYVQRYGTISEFLRNSISVRHLEETLEVLNRASHNGTNYIRAEINRQDFRNAKNSKLFKYDLKVNYKSNKEIRVTEENVSKLDIEISKVSKSQAPTSTTTPTGKVIGW